MILKEIDSFTVDKFLKVCYENILIPFLFLAQLQQVPNPAALLPHQQQEYQIAKTTKEKLEVELQTQAAHLSSQRKVAYFL